MISRLLGEGSLVPPGLPSGGQLSQLVYAQDAVSSEYGQPIQEHGFGVGGTTPAENHILESSGNSQAHDTAKDIAADFLSNTIQGNYDTSGTDTKCSVSRVEPNIVVQRCISNK
jgi:hypothetical protein